jgi:acyl phosphate:glycerol-3-phosphate acyltransferase
MTVFGPIEPGVALLAMIVGYLSGSIPFGLLLTRWAGLGDVRSIGSGNIGATNVLRTGSRKIAAATLALDILKGTAPVLAMKLGLGDAAALVAGASAFIGHLLPVWLHFHGGKGVATYIGVLLGLDWRLAVIFLGAWLMVAAVFRKSSVAALTAAAVEPIAALWMGSHELAAALLCFAAAIWFTHRANIKRLLRGEEPRISFGRRA